MKPMLAATCDDVSQLKFPLYASPKLDGVRAIVGRAGTLLSRSLKPVPNKFVNRLLGRSYFAGLDGELIVGSPVAKDAYRHTVSIVNSDDKPEGANVKFHVFDVWTAEEPFSRRIEALESFAELHPIVVVAQRLIRDGQTLLDYEQNMLNKGYEGLILRSLDGAYKYGRSTMREQGMVKLKRFVDSEFLLLRVVEEESNQNVAKKNALGRTERSTAKAGMVPTGRAGALEVRDLATGVEFSIGTGLDDEDRERFWKNRKKMEGKFVGKYKSFPIGVKDKPRFPVYLGPRAGWDI